MKQCKYCIIELLNEQNEVQERFILNINELDDIIYTLKEDVEDPDSDDLADELESWKVEDEKIKKWAKFSIELFDEQNEAQRKFILNETQLSFSLDRLFSECSQPETSSFIDKLREVENKKFWSI